MTVATPTGVAASTPKQAARWLLGVALLCAAVGGAISFFVFSQDASARWPTSDGGGKVGDCRLRPVEEHYDPNFIPPEDGTADRPPAVPPPLKVDVEVGQLNELIEIDFQNHRGSRVTQSIVTLTPTDPKKTQLPNYVRLYLMPLESDGVLIRRSRAYLARIGDTQSYRLVLCVDATGKPAGEFSGALVLPDANMSSDFTALVQVRLQSRSMPYLVWVGIPLLLPIGMLYTVSLLLRRANSGFSPFVSAHRWLIVAAFFSMNGLLAAVAGIGAAWATWRATAYEIPDWGSLWPDVFTTIAGMIISITAAAAIPFGLSSDDVLTLAQPTDEDSEVEPPAAGATPAAEAK